MQKTKNPSIFSKRRSRLGLSDTVVALILVIVGVSLALLVGSIVGGQLGGWSRKEGIVIETASASLVSGNQLCVTVQFRNSGVSPVTNIEVRVNGQAPSGLTIPSTPIQPGSSGSAYGCFTPGTTINRGDIVTIQVSGQIGSGSGTGRTSDQRSVPVV